jgi:uncharacterized tellurite resistance protein B-like protein
MTLNQSTTLQTATQQLTMIMAKIQKPGGTALLSSNERKLMIALLLGAVVPADAKILLVERARLSAILNTKHRMTPDSLQAIDALLCSQQITGADFQKIASKIPDLLNIEDRCKLVGELWDIALCDHELHGSEERLVFAIADTVGVPRKRVIEQQARAAAQTSGP